MLAMAHYCLPVYYSALQVADHNSCLFTFFQIKIRLEHSLFGFGATDNTFSVFMPAGSIPNTAGLPEVLLTQILSCLQLAPPVPWMQIVLFPEVRATVTDWVRMHNVPGIGRHQVDCLRRSITHFPILTADGLAA